MTQRIISFDARFNGRKGDEIRVTEGWRNGERANRIENITSGNTSAITRGMMLDPPKELNPPLCGKVVSVKSVGGGSEIAIEEIVEELAVVISDGEEKSYDFFISHASEDKESFVDGLAEELKKLGITVWYDNFEMDWGHDLRPNIDEGLRQCKYGIVVLSEAFLGKKKWTEYELNSLFARETAGKRMVFPIWHEIDREDVLEYSPLLADRIALRSHELNKILEKCTILSGKEFDNPEESGDDHESSGFSSVESAFGEPVSDDIDRGAGDIFSGSMMTYDKIISMIEKSTASDWEYDDLEGIFTYKPNVSLTMKRLDTDVENVFPEPWSKKFPDPNGYTVIYNIFYGNSFIKKEYFVGVDGFRGYIPYPEDGYSDNPKLTKWKYKIGEIIHSKVGFPGPVYSYDSMLKRANISLVE